MKANQYTLLTIMALLCSLMQVAAMRDYRAALQYAVDNNTLAHVAGAAYPLDANMRSQLLYAMLYPNDPNDAARYSLAPNGLAVRAQYVLNCLAPIHEGMVNQRVLLLLALRQTPPINGFPDMQRSIVDFVNPFINGIQEECIYYPEEEVQDAFDTHTVQNLPREFFANRRVVKSLVRDEGKNLRYASPELRADREIVTLAMLDRWSSAQFADPALLQDDDFMRTMIAQGEQPHALEYASPALKDDYNVVLGAVTIDGSALEHASERLKNDISIVRAAVNGGGKSQYALDFVSEEMREAIAENQ